MSIGGSRETTSEVPQFVTNAGNFGVDRGMQLAEMGYMPYFGPDVAALSPMQYAGMQNTNNAASAFGMAAPGVGGGGQGGMDPMTGLPAATNYGGFSAYSSGPMYQGAIDQLGQRMPGLLDYYNSMFIDPQTGDAPGGSVPGATTNDTSRGSGGSTRDRNYRNRDRGGSSSDYMRDNQMTSGSGGGYDSVRDMFDGGGAGSSGDTFRGGLLSGSLNNAGVRPLGSSR